MYVEKEINERRYIVVGICMDARVYMNIPIDRLHMYMWVYRQLSEIVAIGSTNVVGAMPGHAFEGRVLERHWCGGWNWR